MVEIFGLQIRMYGLMIGLGLYAAMLVIGWAAKKEKVSEGLIWDGMGWVLVPALVGARLYHVVDFWSYYSQDLGKVVAVWQGGLGIFGGLLGGVLGLGLFVKYGESGKKLKREAEGNLMVLLDLLSLGVPLAQAIGRWGNYFNQELYGRPSELPWAVRIDMVNRVAGYEQFERFHPLFLYESLLSLGLFGVLVVIYEKMGREKGVAGAWKVGSGKYLGVYALGYGLIRFLLEPWRLTIWEWAEIPVAQIFAAGMMGIGFWLITKRKMRYEKRENKDV